MTKITLNTVGSLIDATTAAATINSNFDTIETAFDNTLSRDGTLPDVMTSDLDMNSKQILNLPAPSTSTSALRLTDLNSFVGGGTVTNIPSGGTTNQVLSKNSNTNYDVSWKSSGSSAVTSVALAAPADFTVTGSPVTSTGTLTLALANTATGTGGLVRTTSPGLVTPSLGVATATSVNKVAFTPPATLSTLTIPDGVTLTGPAVSGTAMTLGNAETVTGAKTFGSAGSVGKLKVAGTVSGSTIIDATAAASGTLTLPATTDTLVGKATTDTLTNKTLTSPTLTSPTMTTPTLGAATATSVAFSPTTGGIIGTTTNDSAGAGKVGEYISANLLVGSAVSLTNNTAANVTSISLTAGDWDVWGAIVYAQGGTTITTSLFGSINTTSATFPTQPGNGAYISLVIPSQTGGSWTLPVGTVRVSIAGTTTVYLVAQSGFTVSTSTAYGFIGARRVR